MRKLGLTREEQDEFAAASHQRAAAAAKNGLFAAEIVPVPVQQQDGEQVTVTEDEGIRPGTTAEALARLKPAFGAGRHDHAPAPRRRSPTAPPPWW